MHAADHAQDLLRMARKDFDALRAMLDQSAVIGEVQQSLGTVARLIGATVGETRERDRRRRTRIQAQ